MRIRHVAKATLFPSNTQFRLANVGGKRTDAASRMREAVYTSPFEREAFAYLSLRDILFIFA